jgi:hypothetical protein
MKQSDFLSMLAKRCVELTGEALQRKRQLEDEAIERFFKGDDCFPFGAGNTYSYGIPKKDK